MAEKCIDRVGDAYIRAGADKAARVRCFYVKMYTAEVPAETHRAALSRFALPFLRAKGECFLFGMDPHEIAPPEPGFVVSRVDQGWRVQVDDPQCMEGFPYWVYDFDRSLSFTPMVAVDPQDDRFLSLFSRIWDPYIVTNPQASIEPEALRYAKKTSRKEGVLWLAYVTYPRTMRIGIVGTAKLIRSSWEEALRRGKASRYFTGWELGDPDDL